MPIDMVEEMGLGYIHADRYTDTAEWCPSYDKEVPLRVLISVNDMIERFSDKIAFFISDYKKAIQSGPFITLTDPFIMVTPKTNKRNIFVFDVWDEPSFY